MVTAPDNSLADTSLSWAISPRDQWRWLSADRLFAVLMIGIQIFVLAYLSGARVFPIVMACAALWGVVTRLRLRVEPMSRNLTYAILAISFLLHYLSSPYPLPLDSQFIRSSLAHSVARLLICVQVMQLYLYHGNGRLPIWMGGCGAVALCFATDIRTPWLAQQHLQGIIAGFVAVFALYGSRSRTLVHTTAGRCWNRPLLMSVALIAVVSLGVGTSRAMQKHERSIERFLSEHLGYGGRSARTGFTPSGQLHSVTEWKNRAADRVMLRIIADSAPGYLRGKAFDTYQGSSRETSYTAWLATTVPHPLPEATVGRNRPHMRTGDRIYKVSAAEVADSRVLDVWPEEGTAARIFAPLGTRRIGVNGIDVRIDAHDIVTLNGRDRALPYTVFADESANATSRGPAVPLDEDYRQLLTSLDGPVDGEVQALAAELFADCRTTAERLDAVRRYFRENYTYKLGISVPPGMDPVTYFLTRKPPAHCEYFATGTAVLLRLADVPCRYVVGYVSQEWNRLGGFWVARNMDAHAWVEAFDEESGRWIIVESTPEAGVPQPREPNFASQVSNYFRHRLSIFRTRIREYGLMGVLLSFFQLVWSIPGLVILLGVFVALLLRTRPAVLSISLRWRDRRPAHFKEMHAALALLDRRSREHGFVRRAEETLTQFAARLRTFQSDTAWSVAAAECYMLYVELRYQGQTGPSAVERFRQAVSTIPPTTRRPRRENMHRSSETGI